MKKFFLIFAFGILSAPAFAGDVAPSLFFTPDELQKIEAFNDPTQPMRPPPAAIHLGAVLYYGPENWSVWLEGTRWTPATQQDDLRITEVKPNEVQLVWAASPGGPRTITLRPYQTYDTVTGKIHEGNIKR